MTSLKLVSAEFPFPDAPDIETSSTSYAARFKGPVGEYFLQVQNVGLSKLLNSTTETSVLDVGGGHGQTLAPLLAKNLDITIHGSTEESLQRIREIAGQNAIKYLTGSVFELPCHDRAFNTVVSLRLTCHLFKWNDLVRELCRVAQDRVIIDYPTKFSFNLIEPILFRFKKGIEKNTRHFLSFTHEEIKKAFLVNGFILEDKVAQFFWPMALHRGLGSQLLSRILEGIAKYLGLTSIFGSPVLVSFKRRER